MMGDYLESFCFGADKGSLHVGGMPGKVNFSYSKFLSST